MNKVIKKETLATIVLLCILFISAIASPAQSLQTAQHQLAEQNKKWLSLPAFDLLELSEDRFRIENLTPEENNQGENFRVGFIKLPDQVSTNSRPDITSLTVALKGRNKAIANYEVADADANLGKDAGISILLFDSNFRGITAVQSGNIVRFGNKNVFKDVNLEGQTSGMFTFTLKGVRSVPQASIWVSSIRDSLGSLSLAPTSAAISGRVTTTGSAPEIGRLFSALLQNDDTVGIDLDGTDQDADTAAMSVALLSSSGAIVFAFGIVGDSGSQNFSPVNLETFRNPVLGRTSFNINFSVSGISREVQPGTIKAIAVSIFDSKGNRSSVRTFSF
ncbi:MAG: hypothetical protein JNN15_17625 [Blastocatellia bacterium]|nr:hypothetical protein [Blastocatellia bacterium]